MYSEALLLCIRHDMKEIAKIRRKVQKFPLKTDCYFLMGGIPAFGSAFEYVCYHRLLLKINGLIAHVHKLQTNT